MATSSDPMSSGSRTSEFKVLWWIFALFIGILFIVISFIFWGYAAGDLKWEDAMGHLKDTLQYFFGPVFAGVAYIIKRGGLKLADILKDDISVNDLVKAAAAKEAQR